MKTKNDKKYQRFRKTARFVLTCIDRGIADSADAITARYRAAMKSRAPVSDVTTAWAAYELHRRVHFGFELLLQSLTESLTDLEGGTVEDAIAQWTVYAPADSLTAWLDTGSFTWSANLSETEHIIRDSAFLEATLGRGLRKLEVSARVLFALSLLISTWRSSAHFRATVVVPGSHAGIGRLDTVLRASGTTSLRNLLVQVLSRCVIEPHFATTLRKMGSGMKCSLRFFPEGGTLRPTGIGVLAGFSNDRLTNVFGMLLDLGFVQRAGKTSSLTTEGHDLLTQLGGPDNA